MTQGNKTKTSNQMQQISKRNMQNLKRIMDDNIKIKSILMCRQRLILVFSHLWAKAITQLQTQLLQYSSQLRKKPS